MLVCFGAAWPFSIYKSYRTRETAGKSIYFLWIVFAGYVSGIIHKLIFSHDAVIYLYTLNGVMVIMDITLYYRNKRIHEQLRGV
ncbi:MAG: hypothetical protein A4E54_01834 [Pelotomaculum sp. PtaB.Bin117]|nr:MAG: hypothetical protein A4E54_01834 [Pelotomaculum sp. PtaB.Bin117]